MVTASALLSDEARAAQGYWSVTGNVLTQQCREEINLAKYRSFGEVYAHALECYARIYSCETRVRRAPELTLVGPPTWRYEFEVERQQGPPQCQSGWTGGTARAEITSPPECPDTAWDPWWGCESACIQARGQVFGLFYEGSQMQGAVCATPPPFELEECAAEVVGATFCNDGLCYGTLAFTGKACGVEPPVGEDDQMVAPAPNNNCITSGTLSVCFSRSDPNCGLVNGEPWCASAMPQNGCVSTQSGAVVCTVDAWSAPTEPDGVTPAEPDGVFTHRAGAENEARVYEYFRRETVVASGRPVAVGGPGPGGTGAEGPGEGEFEGELGELATFGEEYLDAEGALARAWNAVVSSESVQAWLALGEGLTSMDDCPRPQFEVFNKTYVIESHCDLAEQVRAELDLVFGFAWTLLAVLVVGKA